MGSRIASAFAEFFLNPIGPPDLARTYGRAALDELFRVPDAECLALREACALAWGVLPRNILPGPGAVDLFASLLNALPPGRIFAVPGALPERGGDGARERILISHENDFTINPGQLSRNLQAGDLVLLEQPALPAGLPLEPERVRSLADAHPRAMFVLDESLIDCAPEFSLVSSLPANVLVLRSFASFYALPGLRLACLVGAPALLERVALKFPFAPDPVSARIGASLVADREFARRSRATLRAWRADLTWRLESAPDLTATAGVGPFMLARCGGTKNAKTIFATISGELNIACRLPPQDGTGGTIQIPIGDPEQNERLANALRGPRVIAPGTRRPRARALMIQGTSSGAGKSFLTAAFCRILLEDGYAVAPFKAQNMALNSFVTARGHEIARAQAVQAAAARLEPDVRMSPVLVKPGGVDGTRIIVNGRPLDWTGAAGADDRVREYAREQARAAYDALAAEYELIVLEGAGSPGEVNLKQFDFVNMPMAAYAGAPVLLAGDIDRGGVFASFVGTLEVLAEWERTLVAGYIVNQFRGDRSQLGTALTFMETTTGRPVVGVVPYLPDHRLPEEDSVFFKSGAGSFAAVGAGEGTEPTVDIVVLDLPYIANFNDFDPLAIEPDVRLRVARAPADLGQPDAVLIPGTKNTLHDLHWLRDSGLATALQRLAAGGRTELVGVCGGMQMLGRRIHDPGAVESHSQGGEGLGLLNLETSFLPHKILRQIQVPHRPSGLALRGYEIHHGRTIATDRNVIMESNREVIGVQNETGIVWGTYLHGIFDDDAFRRWFVDRLRLRRGLPATGAIQARYDLEPALARLAGHVRAHVDMNQIYRMMEYRGAHRP